MIYLAPGDYHRIHSPCDLKLTSRTHFPGDLFPVFPYLAQAIPALFSRNERVALEGTWRHGYFAMVPVGAYNVGSIRLAHEPVSVSCLRVERSFSTVHQDFGTNNPADRPLLRATADTPMVPKHHKSYERPHEYVKGEVSSGSASVSALPTRSPGSRSVRYGFNGGACVRGAKLFSLSCASCRLSAAGTELGHTIETIASEILTGPTLRARDEAGQHTTRYTVEL